MNSSTSDTAKSLRGKPGRTWIDAPAALVQFESVARLGGDTPMSSSTARKPDTSWMDKENRWHRQCYPNPLRKPGVGVRGLYLQRLRASYNRNWRDTLPSQERRQTRYVAYAVNGPDGSADGDLSSLREVVEHANGAVGFMATDVHNAPALDRRPGWNEAIRLLSHGFVDGIAVVNRNAISSDDDEYESVVTWVGTQPALLMVVQPEGAT